MTSTVTEFSSVIDTTFPVPGVDNDTAGFRTNFGAIKNAFTATALEITDIKIVQDGIIATLAELETPTKFNGSIVTATTINSFNIVNTGTLTVSSTATSTSSTTGAIQVAGGVGVAKDVYVGGDLTVDGTIKGDGSGLTNVSVGTLDELTVDGIFELRNGSSSLDILVSNDNLITVTTQTSTKTLVDVDYVSGFFVNAVTLNNVTGIEPGYRFQFYSTETAIHIVNSINTATNKVTTDLYDHSLVTGLGFGGAGSTVIFRKGSIVDISDLTERVTNTESTVSSLSSTLTSVISTVSSLLSRVTNTESTVSNLVLQVASTNTRLTNTESTVSNLVLQVASTNTRLTNTESTVSNLVLQAVSTNTRLTNIESTGTFLRASVPPNPIGLPGDRQGQIFAQSNFVYVCFANYNGVSAIWTRIASTSTW